MIAIIFGLTPHAAPSIQITNPACWKFEHGIPPAEREHHGKIPEKITLQGADLTWRGAIRQDRSRRPALKHSRAADPPPREFQKALMSRLENVVKFHEWREYLYLMC
jgi:hypothetical protein